MQRRWEWRFMLVRIVESKYIPHRGKTLCHIGRILTAVRLANIHSTNRDRCREWRIRSQAILARNGSCAAALGVVCRLSRLRGAAGSGTGLGRGALGDTQGGVMTCYVLVDGNNFICGCAVSLYRSG
jgi:hypothetical protein